MDDLFRGIKVLETDYLEQCEDLLRRKRIRPRTEVLDAKRQKLWTPRQNLGGDALLRNLRDCLASMPMVRSPDQRNFHEMFLNAIVAQLYGTEFDRDYARILRDNKWSTTKPFTFISCPRRWGKTTCVAMFCAAYMLCVPGNPERKIVVFSTSKRISIYFRNLVFYFLTNHPKYPHITAKSIRKSDEELILYGNEDGTDVRHFFSYPSNPETLRGVGGDIVILEEAAYMNQEVVFKVVVPLLGVKNTALIAISTPQNDSNYFSELCELKDENGRDYFNVFNIKWNEKQTTLPSWKDKDSNAVIKRIYEAVGRMNDYQKECQGELPEDSNCIFKKDAVNSWLQRPLWGTELTNESIREIRITCDPNNGGSSETALVAGYVTGGKLVICGVSSWPTHTLEDKSKLLLAFIDTLRSVKRFRDAKLLFIPETNLRDGVDYLCHQVVNQRSNVHVYIDHLQKVGIWMDNSKKEQYTQHFLYYLNASDRLWWDAEWVCGNPFMTDKNESTKKTLTKKKLIEQLKEWRSFCKEPQNVGSSSKVSYSAKHDPETGKIVGGRNDDLVVVLLMQAFIEYQMTQPQKSQLQLKRDPKSLL